MATDLVAAGLPAGVAEKAAVSAALAAPAATTGREAAPGVMVGLAALAAARETGEAA